MRIKIYLSFFKIALFLLFFRGTILNAQQHTITSFSPTSALIGQTVTISGTNFSNITGITVGGTSASNYTVASTTSITLTIPTSANSGNIVISKTGQSNATVSGFVLILPVTRLITDFNGYWSSSSTSLNTTYPNNSQNLLAFEHNGSIYSTGVSNSTLTNNSVSFTNTKWQSLPVNNISGNNTKSVIVYATLADGSSVCNNPSKTIKDVLIDGTNGLNIGTGIANFDADLEFNVSSIDVNKIGDGEPDILITQVADPTSNTFDTYRFINSSSTTVGNSVTAVVNQLPLIGTYYIDVYTLTGASTSNNNAVTNTCSSTNTTRPIRLLALDLADFGITSSNASGVTKLLITPGGTADYGFIAYNNASFVIPAPTVTSQPTSAVKCTGSGNSVTFSVTVSSGSTPTYQWKHNGTNISGATNNTYVINNISAADAGAYTVEVTNTSGSVLSDPAYLNTDITVQPESKTTCLNNSTTLSISAAGNTPIYQWYSNSTNSTSGSTAITGANSSTYLPPVSSSGTKYYYCEINSSGSSSSCSTAINSNVITVTVDANSIGGTISGSSTVCAGSNSTVLSLTGKTGSVTKWQSSSNSSFSSTTDIISTATTLTATNLLASTYYRAIVTNGACASSNSSTGTITVNNTYTWTGNSSTAFNTASNWQLGCVPLSGSDINFTTSPTDICVLGSNVTLGNITIAGTSTKHILNLNGYSLTVQGSLSLSGTNINAENMSSTLVLNGNSAQSISGNKFSNNNIANLTINNSNGVSISSGINLLGVLTLSSGTLTTNDYLTLKSNINYTAMVNQISYTNAISGKVIIEKYYPAKRAYRLISAPATTSNSIQANWQEGTNNTSTLNYPNNNNDPNPGYGTHIAGSTTGANGFDATQTGNPSLFLYDNSSQNWNAISNTNTNTLTAGTPYRMMIRGSRSVNINQADNSPTPTITTLRTFGNLYTGNYSVTSLNSSANSNNFIGNPYQCAVDMNSLLSASSNLNKNYYFVWDPSLNTRGAYVTVDVTKNSNAQNSTANKYLQPGQACFVLTSSSPTGTPSFTFTENSKYISDLNTKYFLQTPLFDENHIQLNLFSVDSNVNTDGALINFHELYSNAYDDLDALKPSNLDENISTKLNGKKLSIESRQTPTTSDIIPIYIDKYRAKNYQLNLYVSGLNFSTIYLKDKFLNTFTKLQSNHLNTYSFAIDKTNLKSIDSNRFELALMNEAHLNSNVSSLNNSQFYIAPNPVESNCFTLYFTNINKPNNIKLYNQLGQIIYTQNKFDQAAAYSPYFIELPKNITEGTYTLGITTSYGFFTEKIIIH